jgi:hypothetical protein
MGYASLRPRQRGSTVQLAKLSLLMFLTNHQRMTTTNDYRGCRHPEPKAKDLLLVSEAKQVRRRIAIENAKQILRRMAPQNDIQPQTDLRTAY